MWINYTVATDTNLSCMVSDRQSGHLRALPASLTSAVCPPSRFGPLWFVHCLWVILSHWA